MRWCVTAWLLPGSRGSQDLVAKPRRLLHEGERRLEIESRIDGVQVREGRRLREELEGEPVTGIVGIEEVPREGEQTAPILGAPGLVHGIVFVEPRLDLRMLEARVVGRDADLAAA